MMSLVDMSKNDCRKALRTLELETYGSMVAVLRAQGHFSSEKKKLLSDVASALSIPLERHKAEVRKAVNDDSLNCIADKLVGPNTGTEWAIEGRRPIPLLPRPPQNTVFTAVADECADYISINRDSYGPLSEGAQKATEFPYTVEPASPEPSKTHARSSSPSGLIVLPSGAAIQMKREPEEEDPERKRRKLPVENVPEVSIPTTSLPITKVGAQGQQIQMTSRTMPFPPGSTPLKIALPTSSTRTPTSSTQSFSSSPKQVIIVSNAGTPNTPSILQKTLSVPMKNSASKPTVMYSPIISSNISPDTYKTRPKTVTPTSIGKPRPNAIVVSQKPPIKTAITPSKPIPLQTKMVVQQKSITRGVPKPQQVVVQQKGGKQAVMTNVQLKTPQGFTNVPVQLRTGSKQPTVQLKQDPGGQMKMISISAGTKILPKPSQPVYVVTSSSTPLSMVTRTVPASCPPRVMTVTGGAQGVKWNQPQMSGKALQAVHVMSQQRRHDSVVLVQKSATGKGLVAHTSKDSSPVIKGTAKMTQKPVTAISSSVLAQSLQQLPVTQSQSGANVILLDLSSQEKMANNAVFADILQASGILSEDDSKNVTVESTSSSQDNQMEVKAEKDEGKEDTSQTIQSLSIEEAVEMLNRSDTPETRAILSQAGIQISDEIADSEEEEQVVENIVVKQDLKDVEMAGHPISPPTVASEDSSARTSIAMKSDVSAATASIPNTVHSISTRPRSLDIYSTALASADINLDSFMEEEDDSLDRQLAELTGQMPQD